MKVTIVIDPMGALHVWRGTHRVEWEGKYRPVVNGREADLYVQDGQDVEAILAFLPNDLADEVREGWTVTCELPDEIFSGKEEEEGTRVSTPRRQPLCLACGRVRIRNPRETRICAKCRRRSQRAKSQIPGSGVWATIVLNPTPNVKSYRLLPFRRLEGWLHRVRREFYIGNFEFSNDWLGTLSLEEEDFEIVETHERRKEP